MATASPNVVSRPEKIGVAGDDSPSLTRKFLCDLRFNVEYNVHPCGHLSPKGPPPRSESLSSPLSILNSPISAKISSLCLIARIFLLTLRPAQHSLSVSRYFSSFPMVIIASFTSTKLSTRCEKMRERRLDQFLSMIPLRMACGNR
jgi:hypothetical protein